MFKIVLGVVAAVLATVVMAKLTFDATVDTGSRPVNTPWAQNTMQFVAWNQERWTAWIRDDLFEQSPQDTGRWSRHANPSIAYLDWEGNAWQAKIDGDLFLLAPAGNWQGNIKRAKAIRYRDWQGIQRLRTVTQLRR